VEGFLRERHVSQVRWIAQQARQIVTAIVSAHSLVRFTRRRPTAAKIWKILGSRKNARSTKFPVRACDEAAETFPNFFQAGLGDSKR